MVLTAEQCMGGGENQLLAFNTECACLYIPPDDSISVEYSLCRVPSVAFQCAWCLYVTLFVRSTVGAVVTSKLRAPAATKQQQSEYERHARVHRTAAGQEGHVAAVSKYALTFAVQLHVHVLIVLWTSIAPFTIICLMTGYIVHIRNVDKAGIA